MIEGVVNAAYEAVVPLSLQDTEGQTREIETVVDTGLHRFPDPAARAGDGVGFALRDERFGDAGRRSEVSFDTYRVTVLWEGQPKEVLADAADTMPLVGMLLLDNHDLSIQVRNGGRVLIQATA